MIESTLKGVDTLFVLATSARDVVVTNNTFTVSASSPYIVTSSSPFDLDFTDNHWYVDDVLLSQSAVRALVFDVFENAALGEVNVSMEVPPPPPNSGPAQ